jgi:hypothetical protein
MRGFLAAKNFFQLVPNAEGCLQLQAVNLACSDGSKPAAAPEVGMQIYVKFRVWFITVFHQSFTNFAQTSAQTKNLNQYFCEQLTGC